MLRSMSIELIWSDRPYPERAVAAAEAGFDRVDLWNWRTSDVADVGVACRDNGISINGFFGNRDSSLCDRQVLPRLLDEFKESVACAVEVGAHQLHLFSNAIRPGGIVVPSPPVAHASLIGACLEGLDAMADIVTGTGITLVLEHLNPVFLPGYLWTSASDVATLARSLGRQEVGVVFDCYHQQLSGGRLTDELLGVVDVLRRIDIAEVPGRYEPGAGEIDFGYMRTVIEQTRWDGLLCFETVPSDGDPETALRAVDRVFPRDWCRSLGS